MDFRVDTDTWFVFSILFIGALSFLMIGYVVLPYLARKRQIKRLRLRFQNRINVQGEFEKRALGNQVLDLEQRNQELQSELPALLQKLMNSEATSEDYTSFYGEFDLAYPDYKDRLREIIPSITAHEVKFCALLRMNLSAKELGSIMNITHGSVNKARYRIRKKLRLSQKQDLDLFLLSL